MNKNYKLVFENEPICPKCKAINNVLLTERGQDQMTDWYLDNI